MIKPVLQNEALIQQIDQEQNDQEELQVWWLGQSGYLIQYKSVRLLIDPYLSDTLTKKYAATNKPHVRISELVVEPLLLKNIQLLTASHFHTDHLDAATILPIWEQNPLMKVLVPTALRQQSAERLKVSEEALICLRDGEAIDVNGIGVYGVPAKHNEIERDENGACKCMGYVFTIGSFTVYHSGDTLYYEELPQLLKKFKIDLAFLPINGNEPSRGVAGNLDGKEAVQLALEAGFKHVIPGHYDLFAFNTVSTALFESTATKARISFSILPLGGYWNSRNFL